MSLHHWRHGGRWEILLLRESQKLQWQGKSPWDQLGKLALEVDLPLKLTPMLFEVETALQLLTEWNSVTLQKTSAGAPNGLASSSLFPASDIPSLSH